MYHIVGSWQLPKAEFDTEMATAQIEKDAWEKKQVNSISETTAKLLTDAKTLEEGKAIFAKNCVACHAADGGGGVGPHLADAYWLHGNKIGDVFKTIKYGIAGKGMTAWQATLSPKEIQSVSNYVLSLTGKPVANPKAPQGVLIGENLAMAKSDSANSTPKADSTAVQQ
jgi:cytochrome c oxidase cbb3-type subunit 3